MILLIVVIGISTYINANYEYDMAEWLEEPFEIVHTLDFYVITMNKPDRVKNIESQIQRQWNIMQENDENDRFPFKIHRIDAVVGKELDLDALIREGILYDNIYNDDGNFNAKLANRYNEVGCYLSHYKTYTTIQERGNPGGYSVIFEDDFILDDGFLTVLDETLVKVRDMDFDMLFLGITGDVGDNIVDNVYKTTGVSWCAHGYLVNNRNIDKILEKLRFMDNIIDAQIFKKANKGELTVYRLYPTIVEQGNYGTDIRNH